MIQLLAILLLAAADDPPGTVRVELERGKTAPVAAKPGSTILCDDPNVAVPQFTDDGEFGLRGVAPGSTLCGVWFENQIPGGLYRVHVTEPKKKAPAAK